jgi:hypothetical protein
MGVVAPLVEKPATNILTVYCVQSFWRDRHKLSAGRLRQYRDRDVALTAARALRVRDAGVVVFSVRGNPEADYWEEPRLLATFGETPELAI